MKQLTTEWVEKAEEDWNAMLSLYGARKNPVYSAACFHAQQCAEKYLKGRLEEAGILFRKTHDLKELLTQSLAIEPTWNSLDPELDNLNRFSILFRYPGRAAVKSDAKKAVEDCRKVRNVIRTALGLPV